MLTVSSNSAFRNVPLNGLADLRVYKDTVFYGINGSGKSTICELLTKPEYCNLNSTDGQPISGRFAFNQAWREKTVGDFIRGGSANGVTTVMMGSGAKELQQAIAERKKSLRKLETSREDKTANLHRAQARVESIKTKVRDGTRKELGEKCKQLKGNSFNSNAIETMLNSGELIILSQDDVAQSLHIAQATNPGSLTPLPNLPTVWEPPVSLWEELKTVPDHLRRVKVVIDSWIREGLEKHTVGDQCRFCAGEFTQHRFDVLTTALDDVGSDIPAVIVESYDNCQNAISDLRDYVRSLKGSVLDSLQYKADLESQRQAVISNALQLIQSYEEISDILQQRTSNPRYIYAGDAIGISLDDLQSEVAALANTHTMAQDALNSHSENKAQAIRKLKSHCCAVDGHGWDDACEELTRSQNELSEIEARLKRLQNELRDLLQQVSVTSATAEFIDKHLQNILGDQSLRVTVSDDNKAYKIIRKDKAALDMSEGEKKLVSLLYFCAEFRTEERRNILKRSIVLFDDLGSELDDSRLIAIDRFVTNFFSGDQKPLATLVFTHSYSHFKLLISRLKDRTKERTTRGKVTPPRAAFYEIYKDMYSDTEQTTKVHPWDLEALELTSDYALSFYLTLRNMNKVIEGQPVSHGTGNYCRKLLEGFTEFKFPAHENFGSRLDELCKSAEISVSPSLSRLVNHLSHSNLDQQSGVLSRQETQDGLIQTLLLVHEVDNDHFEKMIRKFFNRAESATLREQIVSRKAHAFL